MPPAVLAAGLVAGGTLGGAMLSSNAASQAAQLQYQAATNALNFNEGVFNTTQQNMAPYIGLGGNAVNTLSSIYGFGTGGPGSTTALNNFVNTPNYQFALQQGTRALDMSAAAGHMLNSGGMIRASQDYGQGLASQQFGTTIQQLMAMIGSGQTAAAQLGQTGAMMGNQIGGLMQSQGAAQASGVVGSTNPFVSALNTGPGNALAAYSYFNNPMNGFGGAGASPFGSFGGVNPSAYFAPTMGGGGGGGPATSNAMFPGLSLTGTGGLY